MVNLKIARTSEDLETMVKDLENAPRLACDVETTSLDVRVMELDGIGIGHGSLQWYLPFPDWGITIEETIPYLNKLFKTSDIVFHNAKFDLQVLKKFGYDLPEKIEDTMLMSWLVDETIPHGLKYLAKNILDREVTAYNEVQKKVDLFTTKEDLMEEMAEYCAGDIRNTYDLFEYYYPLLEEDDLLRAYYKVEIPFVFVLADIEYRGIRLDVDAMEKMKVKMEKILKETGEKMIAVAGSEAMNFNSPTQLENYLFSKNGLGYKSFKQTPSGKNSTDNEALEMIIKEYNLTEDDFVPLLLKHREYDKLYRTYMIGLMEQAGDTGTIHTNFLQHGTRTGRLSSSSPNLQNIPARSDEWDIRRTFIPRDGYGFIVSDYSQVELRVLAHFSQDPNMVETFKNDGDIHAKTMELTHTERRQAKVINFGIIYGMGPRSLAHTLEITEPEAKMFINKFLNGYPKVRDWMSQVQKYALARGFVTMITGRRRRFYDLFDKKFFNNIRRQSVNTKIQGSAADVIKIAMLKLHKELPKHDAHILIQIHDEVVVEAPLDKMEEISKLVVKIMEDAVTLRVPLKVGMEMGDHWVKG